jgi:hypothetical protein
VAEARTLNAEQLAPYEFTAATQYLRRSMELAGYARFHDANNFAKKALVQAADAKKVAQRRNKGTELPIFNPRDKSMFIDKDGFVRRKSSLDSGDSDFEKPPGLDNEKPPLIIDPNKDAKKKEAK